MLLDLIKRGWWAGKPEKWEEDCVFEPLTDQQLEFFRMNKWVNVTGSNGVIYRIDRGHWSFEQWKKDPDGKTFILPLAVQPKTKTCNCCGHKL